MRPTNRVGRFMTGHFRFNSGCHLIKESKLCFRDDNTCTGDAAIKTKSFAYPSRKAVHVAQLLTAQSGDHL